MTKEEARQFKARWKLVNDFTAEEARRAPLEVKLRQVALLYEVARALGWPGGSEEEVEEERRRWIRLKSYYTSDS
jgi:hypothetical protein